MPLFFGILGGIIVYVAVKDEDRDVAKNLLLLGFFGLLIKALLIWWFYMSILTQLAF